MKFVKRGSILAVLLVAAFLMSAVTPVKAASQDRVRVWVSYQSDKKGEIFQALDKAKATFHYDFPELESYVVSLPEAALNGIIRNPFVVDVETDPARYPVEMQESLLEEALAGSLSAEGQTVPWGIDAVQARDVWDADRDDVVDTDAPTGEGITVCIIDTGYSAEHQDLQDVGSGVTGYSQTDDNWARDGYGHGTHVAGTISALDNSLGVVGVTPGTVNFHIVKIFDDTGAWVAASDLTAAIYSCQDAGADVISMSLGGTSSNRREERAFDSLYAAGILHIAAAGNEQEETPGAFSYPASYGSVVSVAAVDESMNVGTFSLQNSAVEIAAPGVGVLSTIPYIETNDLSVDGVDYGVAHVEFSAYGTASGALVDGGLCTSTGNWSGQVVLCERGEISFLDKVLNVQNSGGSAAVIYNNEPGNFLGTLGDGTSSIIGFSLSQEDGQYLVANKLGLVASISSLFSWPDNGYEAWDGTSMATPHVSGVAALIWSANPGWTNVEIREAMNATAMDLGSAGRDSVFGFGLVQAADALAYLGGVTPPPPPPPPPTGDLVVTIDSPAEGTVFADKNTVSIIVSLTSDGDPIEGANVTVVVTGTMYTPKTLTGVTAADGMVSLNYRINARKTGTGTYTIDVTASKDGYDPVSTSGTFIVQ